MMKILYSLVSVMVIGMVLSLDSLHAEDKPPLVVTSIVTEYEFRDEIEALGELRANESVILASPVTEVVSRLFFSDGQRVEAGKVLVEMTNAEETAQLEEARARLEEATRQYARVKELAAKKAASESLIEQRLRELETVRAQLSGVESRLRDRRIVAPFTGVIGLKNLSVGTLLQTGDRILTLDDDSVMKLDFSVPTRLLAALKKGLPVEARTDAFAKQSFTGKVTSIDSRVSSITRSIVTRALLSNQDRLLKPGMLMTVHVTTDERKTIAIAEESLVMSGDVSSVFVVKPGDKRVIEKRTVKVGARKPGLVEIVEGLAYGEEIVTRGIQKVRSGSVVRTQSELTLKKYFKQQKTESISSSEGA